MKRGVLILRKDCAEEGLKPQNITHNNNVSVGGVRHTEPVPEKFITEFGSAVALGYLHLLGTKIKKIWHYAYSAENMQAVI